MRRNEPRRRPDALRLVGHRWQEPGGVQEDDEDRGADVEPASPWLTRHRGFVESWPAWLSDDRFAYGGSGGKKTIYEQTVGSSQRRIWFDAGGHGGVTAIDDGAVAVFVAIDNPITRKDLWVWTRQGPPGGRPLVTQDGDQAQPQLSPDGRWLAYVSNETGRNEVFVAAFRYDAPTGEVTVGDSVPVSTGGGHAPRWRGDGRELFYLTIEGAVMALEVGPAADGLGPSRKLFTAPGVFPEWGVTHDGSRLLFAVPTEPPPPLRMVQNWRSLLPD